MENIAAPPRCLCGLTKQEVFSLDERDRVPLVDGDCQNGYFDAGGIKQKCGMPVGLHPSELTGKRPLCL